MKVNVASTLNEMSSRYQKVMMNLSFRGQAHGINQISYETDDFVVVELQDSIEVNGHQEQYLAVTRDHLLYSIDVFADPDKVLTTAHGCAEIRCI